MVAFKFRNVRIESYALHLAEQEVSSAEIEDRLSPVYDRLKIPYGTLEKLSGIKSRRLWDPRMAPSKVATIAAEKCLEESGVAKDKIGMLINCSVTRDYFEPATSSLVHRNLELSEQVISTDVTNACIGFSTGMQIVGTMIDSGVIEAGLLVSGETVGCVVETSIQHILERKDTITRDELIKLLPTFTLGCGSVAMLLCHDRIATRNHRPIGMVSRSATQFNDLCVGNADYGICEPVDLNPVMYTESNKLMLEAAKLGGRMWQDFSEVFGWSREEIDHIFCHQVGKQVNNAFYKEMTLDIEKEFTVYQRIGNLVSAALPAALFTGIKEKPVKEGEKILLTGFGSGLNSNFIGIEW